ncbi:MAG: TetR family transcriptional regulator, partial [Acidimicrobiales bacterium]|nr:TetR family transcriptional regulator [Acidimicrobiales bacterium]
RMSSRHTSRSREESKELTRQALLRAALKLLSRNSFDSISLREVTKEAGISPTAFYRHFDDMEELGLELVDESFGSLRDMLREARSDPALITNAIDKSVETVVLSAERNKLHFRFIARERYGGVKRIRKAIRRQLQLFADELSIDLAVFPFVKDWSVDDRRMLASLIAETMVHMAAELLEADASEREEIIERARQQLVIVNLGVPMWSQFEDRRKIDERARAELEQ